MLSGRVGRKGIMAQGRTNTRHFIGCNANADAGTTDQNTSVKFTGSYRFGHRDSNIGIITGLGIVGTEVLIFVSVFR